MVLSFQMVLSFEKGNKKGTGFIQFLFVCVSVVCQFFFLFFFLWKFFVMKFISVGQLMLVPESKTNAWISLQDRCLALLIYLIALRYGDSLLFLPVFFLIGGFQFFAKDMMKSSVTMVLFVFCGCVLFSILFLFQGFYQETNTRGFLYVFTNRFFIVCFTSFGRTGKDLI